MAIFNLIGRKCRFENETQTFIGTPVLEIVGGVYLLDDGLVVLEEWFWGFINEEKEQ